MASNNNAQRKLSEGVARSREGLHMRPLNVEKGQQRFSAHDTFPPQTATWRNNLIALSQRRNLLFTAYSHRIYVWEPAGSSQTLGSKPQMIITPVMKEPHSAGYISPVTPHAINSILVDDLGREEVLLLATDSGNVCGYRVEAIYSALARATENNEECPLDGSQVDPFFVEYVEASAWGLAIHKFARLIAVTANTGLVTVFAFALVNSASGQSHDSTVHPEEEDDFTDYGQTWLDIKSSEHFKQLRNLMPDKHRKRNIRLTYTGHFSNIPSVSFFNCDLDPNGTWMVSTDIDNKLLVWKVWESLGPFNVYHFNDISFKSFPEALGNDIERGWTVLALDPRTFHLLKSTEEACGGHPQRRLKDGQSVLDLTKLSTRIPNASHLYNYFPPVAKPEPEQPVLPDILGADCCITRGHRSARPVRHGRGKHDSLDSGKSHPYHAGSATSSNRAEAHRAQTSANSLRPSDSTDASSHRAVDGSVREDTASHENTSDEDMVTEVPAIQENGDAIFQTLDEIDDDTNEVPLFPRNGPLTTPEFLRFALSEALGGDIHGAEEYFDDYSAIDEDTYDDDDDREMDEADDDTSESGDASTSGAAAYQVFDRMSRRAFPDDPGLYERAETALIGLLPPAPAPLTSNFPILHFSQTDIRLIPHPFASHASVVCGAPLRQPFTHPIVSIRACDRFNMVKYIPEHGIVVAASQKGRAAVIALTESESTGLSFRVDWIVPFESQEKYGDRPLIPLLGMTVSPIQGFEMPPDVPYIPRGVDASDLSFRYRCPPTDDAETPPTHPSSQNTHPDFSTPQASKPTSIPHSRDAHDVAQPKEYPLSLPECHAQATSAYQPEEPWRGWNPSRRYRVLLMYADHTVMSYEFWYNWNTAGGDGNASAANEEDEDQYLVV